MTADWWPDWSGEIACVCASGPSLVQADVDACRGRRVIVTNDTHCAAPWADVLYASDARWFRARDCVPGFAGLKVCGDVEAEGLPGVHRVRRVHQNSFCLEERSVCWMGNSGSQAIDLAIHFGARRIALLGFDMRLTLGQPTHWHGDHPDMANPTAAWLRRWCHLLDAQAEKVRARGIEIVNCTPGSALRNYRKMAIGDALARWRVAA